MTGFVSQKGLSAEGEGERLLPAGWRWTTVGEVVVDAQPGFASGEKAVAGGVPQLRMNNIDSDGKLALDLVRTVPPSLAAPRYLLEPGDVLFCQTNSLRLVGKTALFELDGHYVYSNHLCRLRPDRQVLDPRWLAHWLHSRWRSGYFTERCKAWVNQATVGRAVLLETPIPLPPLPEQRQIVAALDAALAQVSAARARLTRVPEILKRYRASMLKAACEGRLVPTEAELARAEGREYEPADRLLAHILEERRAKWEGPEAAKFTKLGKVPPAGWESKYKEPEAPDVSDLRGLPEGWCWATVGQMATLVTKGSSPVWQGFEYTGSGVVFLRSQNVRWGSLDLSDLAHLPEEFNGTHQNSIIHAGDVLLNLVGASVGRSAIASGELDGANSNQAVGIIRLIPEGLLNRFLMYFLISPMGQEHITATKADVARANFNLDDIRPTPIPLPPLTEQCGIVAEVERLLGVASAVEARVVRATAQVEQVTQALLARAFRGELVAPGPGDETLR